MVPSVYDNKPLSWCLCCSARYMHTGTYGLKRQAFVHIGVEDARERANQTHNTDTHTTYTHRSENIHVMGLALKQAGNQTNEKEEEEGKKCAAEPKKKINMKKNNEKPEGISNRTDGKFIFFLHLVNFPIAMQRKWQNHQMIYVQTFVYMIFIQNRFSNIKRFHTKFSTLFHATLCVFQFETNWI